MANSKEQAEKTGKLTLMGFFSMTASMVLAAYEFPTFATSGFSLVFFLIFAGVLFFLPVALCAAEMATTPGWEEGGVFTWSSRSLNSNKLGFAHVFYQWFATSIGFSAMMYYVIGALAYLFNFPALSTDPLIKFVCMVVIFWIIVFSQFGGTKNTAIITKVGFIAGILIPAICLILLGIWYVATGHPIHTTLSGAALVPDFSKFNTLVVFVTFVLSYIGVEASATHVHEMENPNRDYPLSMFMLVVLAIVLNTLGGLTIAMVIPKAHINLSSGIIQTYSTVCALFSSTTWYIRILALLMAVGVCAELSAWVVGPSFGMLRCAQEGYLPKYLTKVNKNNVPVRLIVIHALIVSFWFALLTFGGGTGGGNMSFLTAMSLTTVTFLMGYIIFFCAYLRKVHKLTELKSSYNIPGGKAGKTIVSVIGLIVTLMALCISFVPPQGLTASQSKTYEIILVISFIIIACIPFVCYSWYNSYKKSHGIKTPNEVAVQATKAN